MKDLLEIEWCYFVGTYKMQISNVWFLMEIKIVTGGTFKAKVNANITKKLYHNLRPNIEKLEIHSIAEATTIKYCLVCMLLKRPS